MNFIAATVELRSHTPDPINAYGLDYCGADVFVQVAGTSLGSLTSWSFSLSGGNLSLLSHSKTYHSEIQLNYSDTCFFITN